VSDNVVALRPVAPREGGDRHTLAGILRWYIEGPWLMRKATEGTRKQYRQCCRRILGLIERGLLPQQPKAVHWRWLQTHLHAVEGLSPGTINWILSVVLVALTECADDSDIGVWLAGQLRACKRLPTPAPQPRSPPMDCVARVLQSGCLRHRGERAWVVLLWEAGLRRGEALGLQPQDLDRATGVLQIRRQRHRDARKRGDWHTVRLRAALCDDLAWCIDHWQDMRPPGTEAGRDACHGLHRWVFPWGDRYLAAFGRRIRAAIGPDVDRYFPRGRLWHGLRHGGATFVATRPGATPYDVQCYLGDRSPEMATCYSRAAGMRAPDGRVFDGSMHSRIVLTPFCPISTETGESNDI
jgi:integrase